MISTLLILENFGNGKIYKNKNRKLANWKYCKNWYALNRKKIIQKIHFNHKKVEKSTKVNIAPIFNFQHIHSNLPQHIGN